MIVEDEQNGKEKAEYGKSILKDLSKRLTEKFGKGFSEQNLRNMRQFYKTYSNYDTPSRILENNSNKQVSIHQMPSSELLNLNNLIDTNLQKAFGKSYNFTLSWSNYLILMRIENLAERRFYEIEALNQNWSEPQLKRQYHSSLYERLALSRNKDEVMKLATEGQSIVKPEDILKNPLSLEFLGLEERDSYSESDMEPTIIAKLQQFLLELGKGFLFEARQKRFTFDDKHFFVDMVFYNRLLQYYVLNDLKTDELVHHDLGQMQMYVKYYDRFVKLDFEKSTIGILLCKKKNNAIVELTLPKDANIYASEYSLYLPDKQLLQQKLAEWLIEYENINEDKI
jgi:predicted nuclease of restriction endonuclease-like (RecB) superfamily